MKRFLILFFIVFCTNIITTPAKSLAGDRVEFINLLNNDNFDAGAFHKVGTCERRGNQPINDTAFLHSPTISDNTAAYIADNSNQCISGTQIYILHKAGNTNKRSNEPQCWESKVTPTSFIQSDRREWKQCNNVPNCEAIFPTKWYENKNGDKQPVFVHKTGKVITYNNSYLPKSLIDYTDYKVGCIGYVCRSGNVLTYGCQDGSCDDPCPEDNNEDNGGGGGDGGNDSPEPTPSEFPNPPAEPKDNSIPDIEDVVKPYLDLLID